MFFSQSVSAGTTSNSTSVTQTLKDMFQKQAASSQKASFLFSILHSFDTLFYTCLMLILQCFVKVLDLDYFNI